MFDQPGYYRGRHYSDYMHDIRALASAGEVQRLERLLLQLIAAMEAENRVDQLGASAWPYDVLGHVYNTLGRTVQEVAIYERYQRQPCTTDRSYFAQRLARARGRLVA